MTTRNQELTEQVLLDLADMNIGPGASVPFKTIWLRCMGEGGVTAAELASAIEWGAADEQGYFIFREGGIAGLGTVVLTDRGYECSRTF